MDQSRCVAARGVPLGSSLAAIPISGRNQLRGKHSAFAMLDVNENGRLF